jgi:hypothetical protein
MDGSVAVPFPSVGAVEMIHSLAENLKMRFNMTQFCVGVSARNL